MNLKNKTRHPFLLTLSLLVVLPVSAGAQAVPLTSLGDLINQEIQKIVKTRLDLRDDAKQSETPSASENSTSLVDRSSASALIGMALNLAGLSASTGEGDGSEDTTSASVTATAYSVYTALRGVDPLNPHFYTQHAGLRRISFTLGYDDEKIADDSDETKRARLAGAKVLILSREPDQGSADLQVISEDLKSAVLAFGRLSEEIKRDLLSNEYLRRGLLVPRMKELLSTKNLDPADAEKTLNLFVAAMENPPQAVLDAATAPLFKDLTDQYFASEAGMAELVEALGDSGIAEITAIIERAIDPFVQLQESSLAALQRIRNAPQLSVSVLTKQREGGGDDYKAELIYDHRKNRWELTMNGAYEYKDGLLADEDSRGARFASQLKYQISPEASLAGRPPSTFSLAAEGKWMSGEEDTYKAQAKFTLPLADGIEFPISVTYANRTELIEEDEVRGQFGFTLDTAQLLKALLPH